MSMFEIPDEDIFWDDFPLEEDSNFLANKAGIDASYKSQPEQSKSNEDVASDSPELDKKVPNRGSDPSSDTPADSSRRRSERKFPGPAGLLPAMPGGGNLNTCGLESSNSKEQDAEEICLLPPSQPHADGVYNSAQWRRMLEDLGEGAHALLGKFSIKALLLRASRKMLHKGKAPLVFGVMENLDMQGPDASFVIRDETGKMKGSLHKDLIQDPSTALQAGCVLILRQVSVISPSVRTHYLNVTPGNVVLVYSPTSDAKVAKRTWPSSSGSPPDPASIVKEPVGSPSLREIIEESERELSASLRNFHSNYPGRLSSPSNASSISSPPLVQHMVPGQRFSSPPLFSSGASSPYTTAPGGGKGLRRPGPQQMRPSTSAANGAGLYSSATGPRCFRPALRFPNASLSESPIATGAGSQQFRPPSSSAYVGQLGGPRSSMISGEVASRQNNRVPPLWPPHQKECGGSSSAALVHSRSSMISGEVASRQSNRVPPHQQKECGGPSIAALVHSRSSMISGEVASRQNNRVPPHQKESAGSSSAAVVDPPQYLKQSDNKCNSSASFSLDLDFPEDNADGDLLQLCDEALTNTGNIFQGTNSGGDSQSRFQLNCNAERANPFRVKSDVISNIFKDCFDENTDTNLNSQKSDFGDEIHRSNTVVQTKSGSGKSFTFKRNSSVSPSESVSGLNSSKRKCMVEQNPLTMGGGTNQSVGSTGLTSLNSNISARNSGTTPVSVRAGFGKQSGIGQRDSRVQLGQGASTNHVPPVSSGYPHALANWDDDLTDDLLMSQLSEEF